MQKIILINDIQNCNAQEKTQKLLMHNRHKLKNASFEDQDLIISEINKLQNLYFQIKAEEGYFFIFDDFLKYSKLSINILFDYLYKRDGSIRLNIDGTKMLINFCYELITENKNKNNEELSLMDNAPDIPDYFENLPTNVLLLNKEDFIKSDYKKNRKIDWEDDDDDDMLPFMGSRKDKYKEANQAYFLLIEFLLKALEDKTDPIWSWQ